MGPTKRTSIEIPRFSDLGWVRQAENQYLDIGSTRLAELSPEIRALAGVEMYGALGFHDPRVRA